MRAVVLLLLLLAAPALGQTRPQPPCAAQGPLREAVCADPALRAAEARLRGLERALAAVTARPATMAVRAAAWQPAPDDLSGAFEDRIAVLEEALRIDRAMRRLEPADAPMQRPARLETRCLGAVLRDCRVTGAGVAVAEDGRSRVLWQAQRGFTERDGVRAGIVLLAEARGGWRLLGWDFAGHEVAAPRLSVQDGVTLLHVAGRGGGSGARNTDLLFRRDARGWAEVETESWRDTAAPRLPPGTEIWQALDYDIAGMVARGRLARGSDANCCPSAGGAAFGLRLDGTKLVLEEVLLDAVARAQRTAPETCPAERATWRLDAPEAWTLELTDAWRGTGAASALAMRVRPGRDGRDAWFIFAAAQGYGSLSILPVEAPGPATREDGLQTVNFDDDLLPLLRFHAFDAALTALPSPPQRGEPAPRWLFMPGLGQALHYGQLPGRPEREAMPVALWKLDGCRPDGR